MVFDQQAGNIISEISSQESFSGYQIYASKEIKNIFEMTVPDQSVE